MKLSSFVRSFGWSIRIDRIPRAILGPLRSGRTKGLFLAVLFTVRGLFAVNGQVLGFAQLIEERDITWMHANGFPDAQNGVAIYKLLYWTPDLEGNSSIASAAFISPLNECARPLVCFIHGTMYVKEDAPSRWHENSGEVVQGYTLGGYAFACVLPDLLGLGDSPGPHPYLNASANARTSIDAVRAAREFEAQQGSPLDSQLFLMGVSAGAQTCLATNEMMQDQYPGEFTVTATGAISGPYAIYPTIKDIMTVNEPHNAGSDVVYMLLGYQAAYPGLFSSTSDFLVDPYDVELPPYYDGAHEADEINPLIPAIPSTMIPFALKLDMVYHPDAALNQRLRQNNVYDWAPEQPVKLCYCGGDVTVSPTNSIIAHDSLVANGGQSVDLVELSPTANHGGCGDLGRPYITQWFRSLKADCNGMVGLQESTQLSLYPNPSNGPIAIDVQFNMTMAKGNANIDIWNAQGQSVLHRTVVCEGNALHVVIDPGPEVSSGIYSVVVTTAAQLFAQRLVFVR